MRAAGKYRHRFAFLVATSVETTRGGRTKTWQTLATVDGEIVTLAGEELEIADRRVAGATHQVKVRWNTVIGAATPQDLRIWWQNRTLEVLVLHDEMNDRDELVGLAKEVKA